jgi:hypothetical protein
LGEAKEIAVELRMKRTLRILALLILVVGIGLWLWGGQNRGWTKTSKAIERIDPVTEIVYPDYEKGFYPGIDFLLVTGLVAAALFGSSFFFQRKN